MLSFHRHVLLVAVFSMVLQGCYTATFVAPDSASEIRLDGPRSDERIVRTLQQTSEQHYFIFGLWSRPQTIDIGSQIRLKDGESLVNTRITHEITAIDALIQVGVALLTQGVSPFVWQMWATKVSGDVVVAASDDVGSSDTKASVTAPTPTPLAPSAPKEWRVIYGGRSYANAKITCEQLGMRLPTRQELKAERSKLSARGNVWTSETDGDEVFFVNMESAASFLKSPTENFGVVCVGEG